MESFEIDLGNGVVFRYHGPQTERRVHFGTVGKSSDFNNLSIERSDWGGDESEVTSVACGSSDWVLVQFVEHRRDWVVERLRKIAGQEKSNPVGMSG
jgi:hypothetical protein